jgi:hypothetical protein
LLKTGGLGGKGVIAGEYHKGVLKLTMTMVAHICEYTKIHISQKFRGSTAKRLFLN